MRALVCLLLLMLGSPAWGAWALVQSKEANSDGGTTQAVTFDSTPTVGNTILVGFETPSSSTAGVPIMTDNKGNAYAVVAWTPYNGNIGAHLYCAVATVATATFTITATGGTEDSTIFAREYSGGSCSVDQVSSASTGGSPYDCGTITTLNANDLLITLLNNNGGGTVTFTPPSGYGNQQSQTNGSHQSGSIADKVVSATGTFTPTWTTSGGATASCIFASLKQASGGGGTTVAGSFVVAN